MARSNPVTEAPTDALAETKPAPPPKASAPVDPLEKFKTELPNGITIYNFVCN